MKRLIIALFLVAALVVAGTAGYCVIEGWPVLDSLYMTVIGLTTAGFEEVHPLGRPGQAFTILLLAAGVGIFAYTLGVFARYIMEGELKGFFSKRKMEKSITKLSGHFIVCGFGRIGRVVAQDLKGRGVDTVVVEKDESLREELDRLGLNYILGDATSDMVLSDAGVERARGLVTVLDADADNLFITMSARQLNPGLHLIARGTTPGIEKKLMTSGANRVIMPHLIGGKLISQAILMPHITDFLELTTERSELGFLLQEVEAASCDFLHHKSLKELDLNRRTGVIVLAVKKPDGEMMVNPNADYRFKEDDILIVLGTPNQVNACMSVIQASEA